MRTHVTFRSDVFNRTDVRPNFINPCCFGEDLADWLIKRLTNPQLTVATEPCQEDWGWEMFVTCNNRRFFIGIGQYGIEGELGWLCFVQSRLPFFKKWFGTTDVQEQQQVCAAFHSVLASAPEIRDIRWHKEENLQKGNETDWKPEPGAKKFGK